MSITSFENTQNIQALQIFQDEMDVITSRTFPIANGYSTCPCGSVVKGIRKHLETGKHQVYEARLTNSITRYTQLIATYEQEQEQEEEEPNCHICGQETDVCTCNDEYINYKSYHGQNGHFEIDDLDENYNQEYIELYIDNNHVDMTDKEAVENLVLNDEECKSLMDQDEHLEFIDIDEVMDIRNELIKHTTITPDICNIIADYAANFDFNDFFHGMIEDDNINFIIHDIVSIDLCYFSQELCLVFQSREYRDDHYVYNDGYLHTLNYLGEDEYGNAKYARQSNRGTPINHFDFNVLDYGRGNFTIQYKNV